MKKDMKFDIYDNKGKTVDRYTVVISSHHVPHEGYSCLVLSPNPDSPQGVSQWAFCYKGKHLGEKISFMQLPLNVQQHIKMKVS